jgi:hypothetical protein
MAERFRSCLLVDRRPRVELSPLAIKPPIRRALGRKRLWRWGETMGLRVEVATLVTARRETVAPIPSLAYPESLESSFTERCQPLLLVVYGAYLAMHQRERYESPSQPP